MKKSRFTETRIIAMLQQYDSGKKVTDICRDKGITSATFYRCKCKYGGMDAHGAKKMWKKPSIFMGSRRSLIPTRAANYLRDLYQWHTLSGY
ncbi:hypothetical protein E0K83_12305 [Gramella sp. BOM4]|nr:hypothetical protein [Christiangramia bathymodioli]